MEERKACALLKAQFEAAGYAIDENVPFDEDGLAFDLDGFDHDERVGYEYVTAEAGDGWDVDENVIAELGRRREKGLYILVIDEAAAPDEASLKKLAEVFLAEIEKAKKADKKPPAKKSDDKKPEPAKKADDKQKAKPPPTPKKSPAKKPAAKKKK